MAQRVDKQKQAKNNKTIIGAMIVFVIVAVAISGLWYIKSGAFKDVMLSALDKDGGLIETIQIGGQKINVTGAVIMSKLNAIQRSGFPFKPGVSIDVDITVLPEGSGVSNKSSVKLPLKGLKVENSLFSTSDISIWMPKALDVEITDTRGTALHLALRNKAMLLKLIGGLGSTEMQMQALDLDVTVGNNDDLDQVTMGSLSIIFDSGVVEQKSVLNVKKLIVNLADRDVISFENIAYMGMIKNKPSMNDVELQRLIALFKVAPNDLEVLRGLIKKLAEASTGGELNLKVVVGTDSYLSVKSYMNRDQKNKDNMDMQAIVTTHNLDKIVSNLIGLGVSAENIKFILSILQVVAEKSEIEGVEHLDLVVTYKDYSVKLNGKEIINIDTAGNTGVSLSSSIK